MNRLSQILTSKIRTEGPLSFKTFMEMALYYPELGYYASAATRIGSQGDFYTSPHLHEVFGAVMARQLAEMWGLLDEPDIFHVIEMGGGTGYLCNDILQYLSGSTPYSSTQDRGNEMKFLNSLRYVFVEPFPHFESRQRALLNTVGINPEKHISWVGSLQDIPQKIHGCLISNELLDAFPVHLVQMSHTLQEVFVTVEDTGFEEELKPPSSPALFDYVREHCPDLPSGYRTEINIGIKEWLRSSWDALSRGFIMTVDYGYSAREYYSEDRTRGTLLCYHRHSVCENPYQNIGEQDITAHVNFSSLHKWGTDLGLKTLGFCPQGTFLVSLGIDELLSNLYNQRRNYGKEIVKIKGLLFPQGMGASHNVMIQYKGEGLPELRGFSLRNVMDSL